MSKIIYRFSSTNSSCVHWARRPSEWGYERYHPLHCMPEGVPQCTWFVVAFAAACGAKLKQKSNNGNGAAAINEINRNTHTKNDKVQDGREWMLIFFCIYDKKIEQEKKKKIILPETKAQSGYAIHLINDQIIIEFIFNFIIILI